MMARLVRYPPRRNHIAPRPRRNLADKKMTFAESNCFEVSDPCSSAVSSVHRPLAKPFDCYAPIAFIYFHRSAKTTGLPLATREHPRCSHSPVFPESRGADKSAEPYRKDIPATLHWARSRKDGQGRRFHLNCNLGGTLYACTTNTNPSIETSPLYDAR